MGRYSESGLNDFVIKFGNVNGTGSASANALLMKAIFRMGVPVNAKNSFPSNVQGMPTWFEIRVNRDGYAARSGRVDIMVAMNAATYAQDLAEVSPGGVLVYDSTWPRHDTLARDDISVLGVPFADMCAAAFDKPRTRILMKNITYLGTLVALLDIEMEVMHGLIREVFATKPALIDANLEALQLGYDYARANFACPLQTRVERADKTANQIVIDGNTAAALGCLYAGATFAAWYPITPSTSLMDAFQGYCKRFRVEEKSGQNQYCIVQAEDEIASVGMTMAAGWCGARAFTSTSGPGLSLMTEILGFAYFAEIPLVVFDIQRVGPSTGMPTRTQQSDVLAAAYASHGDTRHVLLFPANPYECFELAVAAFDLAERLQTPVVVLSDLDIGMNDWVVPELEWDDAYRPDRGKVLSVAELDKLEDFSRYRDEDGDGICYRTLPGEHPKGAYFTRGSGHDEHSRYTEDPSDYQRMVDRLRRKSDTAAERVPSPVIRKAVQPTRCAVVSFGSCDAAVVEALDRLADKGTAVDYMRVRAFPFGQQVEAFLGEYDRVFVVEQNRDAQLKSLLVLETDVTPQKLVSILHYDGTPIDYRCIVDTIHEHVTSSAAA